MGTGLAGFIARPARARKPRPSRMAARRRPLRYRYRATRRARRALLNRCR